MVRFAYADIGPQASGLAGRWQVTVQMSTEPPQLLAYAVDETAAAQIVRALEAWWERGTNPPSTWT